MTLGAALLASVVLILLVYNEKFRKVFFWLAGISAGLLGVYFLGAYLYQHHKEKVEAKLAAQQDQAFSKISPNLLHAKFPTLWVIVDPFQEFGGTFVQPAPSLPEAIRSRPCVPGSSLWHEKYQWVCVKNEVRPEGLPDDAVVVPM
jgi:hypothetical protein